jgi:hypothetical protein
MYALMATIAERAAVIMMVAMIVMYNKLSCLLPELGQGAKIIEKSRRELFRQKILKDKI